MRRKKIPLHKVTLALERIPEYFSVYKILILYLRIEHDFTLKEIGEFCSCSNERVRQILTEIYNFIKDQINNK